MSIEGAENLTFDKMISGLGGNRESIDELMPEEPAESLVEPTRPADEIETVELD